MQLSMVHIVTLILSVAFALWLSINAGRKVKSAEDFGVAGRSAGVSMLVGSILGTIVGGAATVGTTQMAYNAGFVGCWFTLGSLVGLWIMGLGYAARLRSVKLSTVPEFLAFNFGRQAGPVASLVACAGVFFSVVTSMITAINLFVFLFKLPVLPAMLIAGVASLLLVYFGGIGGSGLAGLFKMLLIFVAIFTAGGKAFWDLGLVSGLTAQLPASYLSLHITDNLMNLGGMVVGIIVTQTYVQILFSGKSDRTAMLACLIAGVICVPVGLAAALVGMFMKVAHPGIVPIHALPMYLLAYLPDWLGGLGLAALILSVLGSMAGLALGISTMLAQDVYAPWFKVQDSTRILRANRLSMVMVMVCVAVFSYYNLDSLVLFWNYLSMGLRGAGIFLPFTAALFWPKRVRGNYGIAAMVLGTIIFFISDTVFPWKNPIFSALLVTAVVCAWGMRRGERA